MNRSCRDSAAITHSPRLRVRRDDAGASLVEFAIILPVFALMLFGMIQFGLGFVGWDQLRNAVQTGARLAANGEMTLSGPNCGQTDPAQNVICQISLLIGQPVDTRPAAVDTPVTIPVSDDCQATLTSCQSDSWLDGYYILNDGQWLQIVHSEAPLPTQITDIQAFTDGSGTWACTSVDEGNCTQMTTNVTGKVPPNLATDNVAITIENNLIEVCAERFVVSLTGLPDLHSVGLSTSSTFYLQSTGLTSTAIDCPQAQPGVLQCPSEIPCG